MWAPEMEVLDQLAGGDMPLTVIRGLFENDERFVRGIMAMLATRRIRLFDPTGMDVPEWKWCSVLLADVDEDTSPLQIRVATMCARV